MTVYLTSSRELVLLTSNPHSTFIGVFRISNAPRKKKLNFHANILCYIFVLEIGVIRSFARIYTPKTSHNVIIY